MNPEIREQLETLRGKYESYSYEEVKELGWVNLEKVEISGRTYWPSVWSQAFPDNSALLVVQYTRWYFLKLVGATDCIGFVVSPNGTIKFVDENYLMNEVGHP